MLIKTGKSRGQSHGSLALACAFILIVLSLSATGAECRGIRSVIVGQQTPQIETMPATATASPVTTRSAAYFTLTGDRSSQAALLPQDQLDVLGGRVVSSADDLYQMHAAAVILDVTTVNLVDPTWLREQYDSGVVLVALNFPGNDLKTKAGIGDDRFGPPADTANGPGGTLEGIPYADVFWHTKDSVDWNGGFQAGQHHLDLFPDRPAYFASRLTGIVRAAQVGPTDEAMATPN